MNLFTYLKHPLYFERNGKMNYKYFFKLFFLFFGLSLILQLVIIVFFNLPELPIVEIGKVSVLSNILLTVIFVPIVEEIVFRLWMKDKKYNLFISLFAIISLLIISLNRNMNEMDVFADFGLLILLFIIFTCKVIPGFQLKYFKYIFYSSCVLFGLLHICNYIDFQTIEWYIFPIVTIQEILAGFFLGFIRMKYGFIYGVLFHSSVNLLILL